MPEAIEIPDRERLLQVARLLRILGHEVRLAIIAALTTGEKNVTTLCELTGIRQAIVSQQLRILRHEKVVAVRPSGHFKYYSLNDPRLVQLLACTIGCEPG